MVEPELANAVRQIAIAFQRRNVEYALIGGLAFGLFGRPRATKDADFIVQCPALTLPVLLNDLVNEGFQIDVKDTIRRWQKDKFIAFYRGQARVDWIQPVLPVYHVVLKTAQLMQWQDQQIRVASIEGIILTKMLSFRPQDLVDIETIIIPNSDKINLATIRSEWTAYAQLEPERTIWLESMFAKHIKQ